MKILISSYWILLLVGGFLDSWFQESLYPKVLSDFLKVESEKNDNWFIMTFALIALGLNIIGCVGLWRGRGFGFWAFLIAITLWILFLPIMGYYICSGIAAVFVELSWIVSGVILAISARKYCPSVFKWIKVDSDQPSL